MAAAEHGSRKSARNFPVRRKQSRIAVQSETYDLERAESISHQQTCSDRFESVESDSRLTIELEEKIELRSRWSVA